MKVTAVTVTYGKRAHLLLAVLQAARAQGAISAIVIDNGALEPVAPMVAAAFAGWARVISLGANLGSAAGFKAGIAAALAQGAEFILLLDDDNLLTAPCLQLLLNHWSACRQAGAAADDFAVHANRMVLNSQSGVAPLDVAVPRAGRFLGFHVADMPGKLRQRLAPNRGRARAENRGRITDVPVAPYGGMLFHRDVIARIGLPDEAFFLYVDDYEFSARLTARRGKIHIVHDAVIRDIDASWGSAGTRHYSALFTARLEIQSLAKLYYATRNLTYFELDEGFGKTAIYHVNKMIFMLILTVMALRSRKLAQYRTILKAMQDGRRRSLGINQAYQLQ